MAAIDKIYGTNEQWIEFNEWCKIHKPEALDYFYPYKDYEPPEHRAITNLPEDIDMWLIDNCTIDWVVEQIKEQYDMD